MDDGGGVSPVTVSVTEHLEAVLPDGRDSMLFATSGTALISDLADVLSFTLNAVFSDDHDLVHRLVPATPDHRRSTASKQLRGTFDQLLVVTDAEIEDVRGFMTALLALRRPAFEAVMRAIRRIVGAWLKAGDDPAIAYTDIVAALESLAATGQAAPVPEWQNVDGRKRKLIDTALEEADGITARKVREAVIEAEYAGAKMRFTEFVLANVSPAFYREEAAGATRPVRGPDLRRAVRLAYDIRSRAVHTLADLPSEEWVLTDRADTESLPGTGVVFSPEGLSRLARHVVRSYVASAPAGTDATFNWRAALPGQRKARAAPQYWIWQADGLTKDTAADYLDGFIRHLIDMQAGRAEAGADMNDVAGRIETLVPGIAVSPARTAMIGLYVMWHRVLPPENHRSGAPAFIVKYGKALMAPSVTAFAAGLLTGDLPAWSHDQWHSLASNRRGERMAMKSAQPLPPELDAALLVIAAQMLLDAREQSAAAQTARWAVEEMPGHKALCAWEAPIAAGRPPIKIDLTALIHRTEPAAPEAGYRAGAEPQLGHRQMVPCPRPADKPDAHTSGVPDRGRSIPHGGVELVSDQRRGIGCQIGLPFVLVSEDAESLLGRVSGS